MEGFWLCDKCRIRAVNKSSGISKVSCAAPSRLATFPFLLQLLRQWNKVKFMADLEAIEALLPGPLKRIGEPLS